MFKHFLITRFNLKKKDWNTNKNQKAVLTEEWHENRFKLFLNYCYPSVAAQQNKNFTWLVFFDTSTSEKYRKIITNLEKEFPNFTPLFINGMDTFLPAIKDYISKCNEDYIITTGLDNDDCLSINFIEEIQKKFNKQDFMALDFINGYTLQISPSFKLGKKLHLYNPFISLIEKNENPITVCNVSHRLWKSEKRMLTIKNKPIWSSIIHLENKVNEFTGYGNISIETFLNNFKIAETKSKEISPKIILSKQWRLSNLYNRLDSHWKVVFKLFKKNLGLYS